MAKGRKTGGRQRGTPNKSKQTLMDYARAGGKTPAEFLIDVMHAVPYKDADGVEHVPTRAEQIDAAKAVASYVHPKLRSAEVKAELVAGTLKIINA